MTRPILYDKAKSWGLVGWVQPLVDIIFEGMPATVDYQLRQLLPDRGDTRYYYRFQARLDPGSGDIDDTNLQMIRDLKLLAEVLIRDNDRALDALCSQLVS